MGFLFKQTKIFYGITAVILLLLILTATACNTKSDPNWVVVASTSIPATPPPPAKTAVPPSATAISPTPPVLTNIEQVLFTPGSTTTKLGHQLQASKSYTYTLYGLVGQKLSAQIVASHNDMVFAVLDKNGQELQTTKGSNPLNITLLSDGDCFIVVSAPHENGHQYGYSLELSLTNNNSASTTTVIDMEPTMQPIAPSPTVTPPTFAPMPTAKTAVQPPEQILFDPEAMMTTKAGKLEGNTGKEYVLQAIAGQNLTIYANAGQPGIKVSITGQDGLTFDDFRSGDTVTNRLPTTQDYFIYVMPQANNSSQDFTLTLSVDNPTLSLSSSSNKEKFVLEPGSEPVILNGTLHYNNGKTYTLSVPKGHKLLIDATPINSGITIFVTGEDGISLGWVPAGSQFSAVMPTSQNYYIDLTLPEDTDELDYGLTVAVQ